MTTPLGSLEVIEAGSRVAAIRRRTRETDVTVRVALDGRGDAEMATGIGFYDHLLTSLAHHSLIDIAINASGDLERSEERRVGKECRL